MIQTALETPQTYQTKKAIFKTHQVIWYILSTVEVLLGFRVLFKMLAANPQSLFVSFTYAITSPFAFPFAGIFRVSTAEGYVLEWSTLVAMAVYAVIAYGIVKFILLGKPVNPEEVDRNV